MNLFTEENIEVINQLSKSYPNNMELGSMVRTLFRMDTFVMSIPNDSDLGKIIREKIEINLVK